MHFGRRVKTSQYFRGGNGGLSRVFPNSISTATLDLLVEIMGQKTTAYGVHSNFKMADRAPLSPSFKDVCRPMLLGLFR